MTTETSEALAKATNSEGLMKSSYFKLKFNPETGQWEKEQIEEVIKKPIFPGIRDVTPDYTEEGKKFKTIPIGGAPDFAPSQWVHSAESHESYTDPTIVFDNLYAPEEDRE